MKKSSKIILYGLLISILYIIFCLYIFKDKFIAKLPSGSEAKKIVQEPLKKIEMNSTEKRVEIDKKLKKDSNLKYEINGTTIHIAGNLPILNSTDSLKIAMMNKCNLLSCQRDVIFSENRSEPKWRTVATNIIILFNEENISDASLLIKNNRINVSAEFRNILSKDRLTAILESELETMDINNSSYIKEHNATDKTDNNKSEDNIELIQSKISNIISSQSINFYRNRAKIKERGIETLDKVIEILKEISDIDIVVKGYTDASGGKEINRWISHERAKSVKNYLGSRGIPPRNIKAEGYGEEGLLYKDEPYNNNNRRVEIEIKRR